MVVDGGLVLVTRMSVQAVHVDQVQLPLVVHLRSALKLTFIMTSSFALPVNNVAFTGLVIHMRNIGFVYDKPFGVGLIATMAAEK